MTQQKLDCYNSRKNNDVMSRNPICLVTKNEACDKVIRLD